MVAHRCALMGISVVFFSVRDSLVQLVSRAIYGHHLKYINALRRYLYVRMCRRGACLRAQNRGVFFLFRWYFVNAAAAAAVLRGCT